jgi:hypothetical protein
MLNWIWFGILVAASIAVAIRAEHLMATNSDDERYDSLGITSSIICISLLVFALVVTSDALILPAYRWLAASLPAPDTALNVITAYVLTVLPVLCFVAGAPLAVFLACDWRRARREGGQTFPEHGKVVGIESKRIRRVTRGL